MTDRLDLPQRYRRILVELLREHVPDAEVWAYGSRITGESYEGSDLDLVVRGPELKPLHNGFFELQEAIEQSNIPILVQAHDWARLPESLYAEIERDYVVVQEAGTKENTDGEWRVLPFNELLLEPVRNGIYKKKEFHGRGVKIVNMGELFAHPRLRNIQMKRVALTEQEKHRASVQQGDLLFARRSLVAEGAGKCCVVLETDEPTSFESSIIRARPDPTTADSLFLYYYFNSPHGLHGLDSIRRQVAVAGITGTDLAQLGILAPSISEQRKIGHILGTLDDKIELNRRMNETLEDMARALFKSWFVDFDPVRAKATLASPPPDNSDWTVERARAYLDRMDNGVADLFPDRMVDSELGEIPDGWEVKALDQIAKFRNGLALQKFRPQYNQGRLPVVKIAQLRSGIADSGEWAADNITPECILDDGDVVFSWSGSLMVKIWCGGRAALNQHLFKVTSERIPKWFYLNCIESRLVEFQGIASDKATTMGHIKRQHLNEAKCAVPPRNQFSETTGLFDDLFSKRISTLLESNALTLLRETLLPRLVEGEVRLHDRGIHAEDRY